MTEALFETLSAPLAAEGIRLRALAASDEAALAAAFADDELWMWFLLVAKPQNDSEMRAWMDDALARVRSREHVAFVLERSDGSLAGTTRFLDVRDYDRTLEIGWTMVFAQSRGTHVNSVAKSLLIDRAFDAGMVRVQLKTDARNVRSRGAIAAIGATFEGILRNYQRRSDGTSRDTAMFSITAAEWPSVRRALDARALARVART